MQDATLVKAGCDRKTSESEWNTIGQRICYFIPWASYLCRYLELEGTGGECILGILLIHPINHGPSWLVVTVLLEINKESNIIPVADTTEFNKNPINITDIEGIKEWILTRVEVNPTRYTVK